MEDKVYKILESIPNVYEGWYRSNIEKTHVTFFFYNITPEAFGDDEEEIVTYNMQVDVWGTIKEEVLETENNVKKLLKENDFIWVDCNPDYESEIGLYHNANRFNYSEN